MNARHLIVLVLSIAALSGCAQYQIQTNKAPEFTKTIDRLAVWSAIGQVPKLADKHWTQSDSFENYVHSALKQELKASGVVAEVRSFAPAADTSESLARFETELAPSMRLLITPAKHQMLGYQGSTQLTYVALDLSLYEVARNNRVWRAQLTIDTLSGRLTWNEGGAKELVNKIIEALRKDRLIGPQPFKVGYISPKGPKESERLLRNPVFSQIKVWQDVYGNGGLDAGELKTFSEMEITVLHYGHAVSNDRRSVCAA